MSFSFGHAFLLLDPRLKKPGMLCSAWIIWLLAESGVQPRVPLIHAIAPLGGGTIPRRGLLWFLLSLITSRVTFLVFHFCKALKEKALKKYNSMYHPMSPQKPFLPVKKHLGLALPLLSPPPQRALMRVVLSRMFTPRCLMMFHLGHVGVAMAFQPAL